MCELQKGDEGAANQLDARILAIEVGAVEVNHLEDVQEGVAHRRSLIAWS